jgi:beta-lactam-binding protein with PASTA domain
MRRAYLATATAAEIDDDSPDGEVIERYVSKGQIIGEDAVLQFGIVRHAGQVP